MWLLSLEFQHLSSSLQNVHIWMIILPILNISCFHFSKIILKTFLNLSFIFLATVLSLFFYYYNWIKIMVILYLLARNTLTIMCWDFPGPVFLSVSSVTLGKDPDAPTHLWNRGRHPQILDTPSGGRRSLSHMARVMRLNWSFISGKVLCPCQTNTQISDECGILISNWWCLLCFVAFVISKSFFGHLTEKVCGTKPLAPSKMGCINWGSPFGNSLQKCLSSLREAACVFCGFWVLQGLNLIFMSIN